MKVYLGMSGLRCKRGIGVGEERDNGGGGEGTRGVQTYLEPGTKPSLNHQKRSLIEKLATFSCSNIEQDDEYEPNLYTL